MMRTRHLLATAVAALALAAGGCGSDDEDNPDGRGGPADAPVNTDTPSADQAKTTPAPNESDRAVTDESSP